MEQVKDFKNTWCYVNIHNHDKLRYMGFTHEPPSSCYEYYVYNEVLDDFDSLSWEQPPLLGREIILIDNHFYYSE